MISLVVAHDTHRLIGRENELPWHIPEDLAYFKRVTMGKPIIMGRKTFESIGRPLPGRTNYVVTRNANYSAPGTIVFQQIEEAVKAAEREADEVMIIGGAEIFTIALPFADRLYITRIEHTYEGDTYFPAYEEGWSLTSQSSVQKTRDGITYVYQIFERNEDVER